MIDTQDWSSMQMLSNYIIIEADPRFLQKKTRKTTLAVLCQQQNVTRIQPGPGTYQLFLLPGMQRACTHTRLCVKPKSGQKNYKEFFFIC